MAAMHRVWLVTLLGMLFGCASVPATGAGAKAPEGPAPPAPSAQPGTSQATIPTTSDYEQVPAPSKECDSYTAHVPKTACGADAPLVALGVALAESGVARDDKLAQLESCKLFEPGLIRALRADLAMEGCGDTIAAPLLVSPPSELRRPISDALKGLSLAAKLTRLVRNPPRAEPSMDRAAFNDYFRKQLTPWIVGQAKAIHDLSTQGARLDGYGKGIAAVEAGLADMRFVEIVRGVPLPADMARDKEVSDAYYAALDEALEPRKARGRDAALVGLREFDKMGALRDARVDRARALLSSLYGGRRIDALDGLLLSNVQDYPPKTDEERIARQLPPFYTEFVLAQWKPADASALRQLLETGIAPTFRRLLGGQSLSTDAAKILARGHMRLGQLYWHSGDFAEALRIAQSVNAGKKRDAEMEFIEALSSVLAGGPKDAAEMMVRGPQYPAKVGDVAALDHVASSNNPHAGIAAFDAAYLLRLVPPLAPDAKFWEDLATRFHKAATRMRDAGQKKIAEEASHAATETAKAIRQAPPPATK